MVRQKVRCSNLKAGGSVVERSGESKNFDPCPAELSTGSEHIDFDTIFQELQDWEAQLRDVDFEGLDDWPDDDDPGDGEIGVTVDLPYGRPKPC